MGTYTYYCEVKDRIREFPQGVYKVVAENDFGGRWFPTANRLITVSDRVWKQGPKGGVKIVKCRSWRLYPTGYITTNEKYMREFAWVKLKAKTV
jgi:hypothetical protein